MKPTEVANIFKMPGEKRLTYFLETVHQSKKVYGLSDEEGWALLGDDDDTDILPLFPEAGLAEAFKKAAGYEDYTVEEVTLDVLLDWLDELDEEETMIAICPNTHLEGAIVEPANLKIELLQL